MQNDYIRKIAYCSCRLLTHNKKTNTPWNMKVERLCIIKKDASN